MKNRRFAIRAISVVLALMMVFSIWAAAESQAITAGRTGAWLDKVKISVYPPYAGLPALQSGSLDIMLFATDDQMDEIDSDPNLTAARSKGLYYDLTINPSGPVFTTGKLNPFHVHKIREALNWLIDRDYIAQTIFGGKSVPKYLPITTDYPDYVRYETKVNELENKYAYDFAKAQSVIAAEMISLGASLNDDNKWTYNSELVTLTFIIRTDGDGNRIPIGNYVADQLEAIGFTVDRQYKTSSQASSIWVGTIPADGAWHLYTGAWSASIIERDQGSVFQEFYTPDSVFSYPHMDANNPDPEFKQIADDLAARNYSSWAQRDTYFNRALELAMEDSLAVNISENYQYTPYRNVVTTAHDTAQGISRLWPYTTRFVGLEGGNLRFAMPALFLDVWNPIAGSNWIYDHSVMAATADVGLLLNPTYGLAMPQRIESASVTATEGLPIDKSSDWITLSFSPVINIPPDTWVDWDATTQTFVTAEEKFPGGSTALIKSVVTYPADLFTTITWHDGSPLDMSDFVAAMIVLFDRAKPESAIYDPDYAQNIFPSFMNIFKGVKIVSTQPLVIETYLDIYELDAEMNVASWWPESGVPILPSWENGSSPMPWHTTTIAILAEENGLLAFSKDKALTNQVVQTNYVYGPSLSILNAQLEGAQTSDYIPYADTLGTYVDATEAAARWDNLASWYSSHGHFWVGTGPFFLDNLDWDWQTADLVRNPYFPDPSSKWERFNEGYLPQFEVFLPLIKK